MLENQMVVPGRWTGNPNDPNAPDADPETPEEKRERERIEKRDKAVAEYADGLRQLADFYEEHPEMPVPNAYEPFTVYSREEFLKAVAILAHGGKVEKKVDPDSEPYPDFHAIRMFGALKFDLRIARKNICKLVTPAVYDCPDSLLEEAAEYSEAAR